MDLYERIRRTAAIKILKSHRQPVLEWTLRLEVFRETDPATAEILAEYIEALLVAGGTRVRELYAQRTLRLIGRPETPLCEHGKYVSSTEPPGTNRAFICTYCYPPGPWDPEISSGM